MAWTAPRTWVTSEVVTAAQMNAHVRDNLRVAGNPLLADAYVTANQGTITTEVLITGLSCAITAIANQTIKITVSIRYGPATADDVATLRIKEGATVLQIAEGSVGRATAQINPGLIAMTSLSAPSVGAHTYTASLERPVGTGNMTMVASTTHPAFMLVEAIGNPNS